jgi:prophage regulatory protein
MAKQHGTPGEPAALPATLPKLLTLKQLRSDLTLSRTTIWRGVRAGHFPRPVQLTPTRIAWREADVLAWLTAREVTGTAAVRDAGR